MEHLGLYLDHVSVGGLSAVSLTVPPGAVVCLSGPSGSGKSRLLRAVADLEPHGGQVHLGDEAQASCPAHQWRQRVMLVPADSLWWFEAVDAWRRIALTGLADPRADIHDVGSNEH